MVSSTLPGRLLAFLLLALSCHFQVGIAKKSNPHPFSNTTAYPLAHQGHVQTHDPSIVAHNGSYYLFHGGDAHLPIYKASDLGGPWAKIGTVFSGPKKIHSKLSHLPVWAPTTIQHNSTFYCFYAVSTQGSRDSVIGVATSDTLDDNSNDGASKKGSWTDHGVLIQTGSGNLSNISPYKNSNAIDPSFIIDVDSHQAYLIYGSAWSGIWQVPLTSDLLGIEHPRKPNAANLATIPAADKNAPKPMEGSFMTHRHPYYYLWYSQGKCCQFDKTGFPKQGDEYKIRVGRSKNVRGPFVDRNGKKLMKDGGTVVYGSNHGIVYAPGGLGVLPGNTTSPDILYYHYLNTSVGFGQKDTHLGWSELDYNEGWPVAKGGSGHDISSSDGTALSKSHSHHNTASRGLYSSELFALTFVWLYVWS